MTAPDLPPGGEAPPNGEAADGRTALVGFIDNHRPGTPADTYNITVTQEVSGPGITATTFHTEHTFTVAGDRFTLSPADVYAVFPPEGSLGDHSHVLPHIVLGRSTLPWEMSADGRNTTPWLALLLFTADDALPGTLTRQDFLDQYAGDDGRDLWGYLLGAEVGWLLPLPGDDDAAIVAAVAERAIAELAAPYTAATGTADAVLARHRGAQATTLGALQAASAGPIAWPGLRLDPAQHAPTDRVSVLDVPTALLTAQLPGSAELTLLAHVRRATDATGAPVGDDRAVVVARRLPRATGVSEVHLVSVEGRYAEGRFVAPAAPYTRLVSLKSWRFACADPAGDFTGTLTGIGREPGTLRLPRNADAEAEAHLAAGRIPVAHRLQPAGTTVSWYRGPLLPGAPAGEPELPADTAARLVRYDPGSGMFDVSWATAWELGRLLALRSKPLARSLYAWKRAHGRAARITGDWLLHATEPPADALPADVLTWFDDLCRLRGVPLNYLVPDERMLPPESIRFVQLDSSWVDCLVDGAFSIGRLTGRVRQGDVVQSTGLTSHLTEHPAVTGFLLRSAVVAGWPGLHADGYPAEGQRLASVRFERVAPDLLLALFAGTVDRVQVHQAPETLHFGLTAADAARWGDGSGAIVDVAALAADRGLVGNPTPGKLAAALVEGVPRITFTR